MFELFMGALPYALIGLGFYLSTYENKNPKYKPKDKILKELESTCKKCTLTSKPASSQPFTRGSLEPFFALPEQRWKAIEKNLSRVGSSATQQNQSGRKQNQ